MVFIFIDILKRIVYKKVLIYYMYYILHYNNIYKWYIPYIIKKKRFNIHLIRIYKNKMENTQNKQKVFIKVSNGYLIRERIANGFYSCLRIPILYTIHKQNLFKEMGIKSL